jgi:hypothetical protein
MNDKLRCILIDVKFAYRQMHQSRNDKMLFGFAQRRFYGYLRALMEFQQNTSLTYGREHFICSNVLKYYLSKL